MAQRVRRAIPPQKVSPSPLGDVYAIMHRAVAQWHTFPHGFTLAAKVFAVFDTHGDTVSFLACFGTGITHGRTRLLSDPARRGTLEARSYLTPTVFFRLVMTGQLLEANWGRVWRQNKPPLFFSDSSIKILYRGERLELNQIHLIPPSPLLHHSDLLQQTLPITIIMPIR